MVYTAARRSETGFWTESLKLLIYFVVPETLRKFLNLLFLYLLRDFAGASGAKLDVSGPALC